MKNKELIDNYNTKGSFDDDIICEPLSKRDDE